MFDIVKIDRYNLIYVCRKASIFEKKRLDDPTQLISTFEVTELVGIVSLLYGMLLHSGTPSRGDSAPPEFPQHTLGVATTGLRMLNHMATLDLEMMQVCMLLICLLHFKPVVLNKNSSFVKKCCKLNWRAKYNLYTLICSLSLLFEVQDCLSNICKRMKVP